MPNVLLTWKCPNVLLLYVQVGALTGGMTSALGQAAVALRRQSNPEWQPSVEVPSIARSSAGMAAFFAVNANIRCG